MPGNDDVFLQSVYQDWPDQANQMYERIEVVGRGSFGIVWMACRTATPVDVWDDEYVAIKNIEVPDDKGALYAEREIRILKELRHPNVIRFIREFPVHDARSRLVVLQLARGANLNQLVMTRGALGMPLARLLCRQLVAAVSYLHGRAVVHRDIKPGNCILENCHLGPHEENDWIDDDSIWSNGPDAENMVANNKWKLMLIDFGFAKAFTKEDVENKGGAHHRGSIINESVATVAAAARSATRFDDVQVAEGAIGAKRNSFVTHKEEDEEENEETKDSKDDGDDEEDDEEEKEGGPVSLAAAAAAVAALVDYDDDDDVNASPPPDNHDDDDGEGDEDDDEFASNSSLKPRKSISAQPEPLYEDEIKAIAKVKPSAISSRSRRVSTARTKMRSMSALGTKAYAAPEIKKKLRKKTAEDHGKADAALTECVADYGMIVDSYSVGWTMRVVLTGVPPNCTISQYNKKIQEDREKLEQKRQVAAQKGGIFCCCGGQEEIPEPKTIIVRQAANIPKEATVLITQLTKPDPEERMTVREAQNHHWIVGGYNGEPPFEMPRGDVPSRHADPVVPLQCAESLTKLVEGYHDHN